MAEPSDAFDELCRRLAVCVCTSITGAAWDKCPCCHGTGLDPERVEVLRGFERETLDRAVQVCAQQASVLSALIGPASEGSRETWSTAAFVAVALGLEIQALGCAAAIEAMAKPAGG